MKQVVALMLLAQSVLAGAAEQPQEFAYAIVIHADGQDGLYEIELPAAVYRGIARSDLGDIRVFNSQGEVVPHAFKPRPPNEMEKRPAVELPLFPLRADTDKSDDLQVRIEKRAGGALVDVLSRAPGAAERGKLRGYVLDATTLKQAPQALLLEWKSIAGGFAGKVRVEGSDDLARWRPLAENAALASLEFGGHRLAQNRVELRLQKYKYLRVLWAENQRPLELVSARAEPAGSMLEARRVWQPFAAPPAGGKAGEYAYDLGGHFFFDRLRIELPQINTLVEVEVLARHKQSEEWRRAVTGVVYRLSHQGQEVASPELAVTGSGERYWLLRVDQKGGGIGTGAPVMNIGWIPQRLVFAARGPGPYQLAYGNSRAKAAAYAINSLIPGYKSDSEFKVKAASLGEHVTLAGAKRLRDPIDYKKWALWTTLLSGVSVLGWMAYRLSRQISRPASDRPKDSAAGEKPR